jgi:hypothetical protein
LSADETAELVRQVDPALDGARIFAQSEGNPLFTLELARASRRGAGWPGRTVEAVIAGQLAPLSAPARETLLWAAAHGRAFTADDLSRAAGLADADLLLALGELERRGLVQATGGDAYDFAHDLVRQIAYRTLSQPRRALFHRHLTRALRVAVEAGGASPADLARHAALAGDDATAARAYALAGEQALRLFANTAAGSFAERGLRHAERLSAGPAAVEARLALLKVRVLALSGPWPHPLPALEEAIAGATREAEGLGLPAAAATGHYLLSVLHQEAGDTQRAERSTLSAAAAARPADDETRARQLANTARCLLELEAEVGRARDLLAEAGAIAASLGLALCELHWARGLLQRWDGRPDEAVRSLSQALALARQEEDRWREYKSLTWIALVERERGCFAEMQARCAELSTVAARLGEDETPFVESLRALALLATADPAAPQAMADALARLNAIDDKSYLAYALAEAARLHRRAGRPEDARRCAAAALELATIMRRRNEEAIARAILASAGAENPPAEAGAGPQEAGRDDLSARARTASREPAGPAELAGPARAIPTPAPTPDRHV